ncbi:BQ2448_4317 [Microbotryum intermedium]|uniref:BQ2448_4317 protein n=1 Tax=Microbotryum intermedium TaxID=269621 RepID=A0A238FG38_9BASI|nr:BQ2448_4317 [Microbotryum intermedium]
MDDGTQRRKNYPTRPGTPPPSLSLHRTPTGGARTGIPPHSNLSFLHKTISSSVRASAAAFSKSSYASGTTLYDVVVAPPARVAAAKEPNPPLVVVEGVDPKAENAPADETEGAVEVATAWPNAPPLELKAEGVEAAKAPKPPPPPGTAPAVPPAPNALRPKAEGAPPDAPNALVVVVVVVVVVVEFEVVPAGAPKALPGVDKAPPNPLDPNAGAAVVDPLPNTPELEPKALGAAVDPNPVDPNAPAVDVGADPKAPNAEVGALPLEPNADAGAPPAAPNAEGGVVVVAAAPGPGVPNGEADTAPEPNPVDPNAGVDPPVPKAEGRWSRSRRTKS